MQLALRGYGNFGEYLYNASTFRKKKVNIQNTALKSTENFKYYKYFLVN